jgi:hypothetical protein
MGNSFFDRRTNWHRTPTHGAMSSSGLNRERAEGRRHAHLDMRMTLFVGTPLNFLLTTHAPERLTLKALTEIGMRCAPHEIHGRATDRTHQPVICTEAKALFLHARSVVLLLWLDLHSSWTSIVSTQAHDEHSNVCWSQPLLSVGSIDTMNIGCPQIGQSRLQIDAPGKLSLCGCCTRIPPSLRREHDYLSVTDACGNARPMMRLLC